MILSLPKLRLLAASIIMLTLAGMVPSESTVALQEKANKPPRSWPMFGGSPSRNMVNLVERGLVADWCALDGKLKNIRWMVEFGGKTSGSPVVADGKVFVATGIKNAALLIAFRESDGKLLWQNTHETAADFSGQFNGAPSNPTVDDKNLFYVTPNCEVVCAGVGRGDVIWRYDMIKEHQVFPGVSDCFLLTRCAASPLVVGDLVFVTTGNGCKGDGELPSPWAPSFLALHKKNGKLVWKSNLPGENIVQGQWASPTFARVNDVPQVIFAGGDCVVYSFEPRTGKLLWKCDCLPKGRKIDDKHKNPYLVGTPVVVGDRLYVGLGTTATEQPKAPSYFLCLDITKKGDVSPKSYEAKAVDNKNSALVWAFGGRVDPPAKKGPRSYFGKTLSTAAVHDGLVYIPEENGYLHCLDAVTGQRLWVHDTQDGIFGSPYWVDGRVFLGMEGGEILIFAHGRTAKLLATIDMDDSIYTAPVAANGVIYVTTAGKLYAIGTP